MKKNKQKKRSLNSSIGIDQPNSTSEFYGGAPAEQPLYQEHVGLDRQRVRKTARHQAVAGRRREGVDPREKMALLAILKAVIMILLLLLAFFMLWKGIKIYEESVWMENQSAPEQSPVMSELSMPEDLNDGKKDTSSSFADRIKGWKEANRLVGVADALLLRNNSDEAIARCQDALRLDPAHMRALERLGQLYYDKKMYPEAVNTYVRLISVDPYRKDLKRLLLQSLNANGDGNAVVEMAQWFGEANGYDEDVQRFLAEAYFSLGNYAQAAVAYDRVLKDVPKDVTALQRQSDCYIRLEQYDDALPVLEKLRVINYNDPNCYKQIAICNAQLGHGLETVQALGKAAHLFGQNTVLEWIRDPRLDPVRQDRTFQSFADRVGGEEFRKYLERMAQAMEGEKDEEMEPQLVLPDTKDPLRQDMLKPQQ